MAHITIIDGHPDPSEARLNHALANRYADAARAAGHDVRRIDVGRLDFPVLRTPEDFYIARPPEAIASAQRDIAWAEHLVLFYPLWVADMPALLKAFIEQTFRPGFALDYGGAKRFPKKLLSGKTAHVVITMGMPAFAYRTFFGAHSLKSLKSSLAMCGITVVRETLLGSVNEASEARRRRWLDRMAMLGENAGTPQRRSRRGPVRTLAKTGLLFGAAYAIYAAATWSRYGGPKRARGDDSLLDRVMPEYDVHMHYETAVHAPANLTFDAIDHTDFERSPIVRALFRAREVLLGAAHVERTMPRGLLEQVVALGWTIVSEEPGHELVLGTVTQPWQPNPSFHALQPDDFKRFNEPGYAKIAFTLRVDPTGPEGSKAQTNTRVQTTDPISRARFRRYWALLSPGIALIRIVLLQQVKHEAESRWKRERNAAEPLVPLF